MVIEWSQRMIRHTRRVINKKEEPMIIICMTIISLLLCILCYLMADKFIVSHIDYYTGQAINQLKMRRYLEYSENYEMGIYEEPTFFNSPEETKKILYSAINNESAGQINVSDSFFSISHSAYTSWIADRDSKELIIRSDYFVFRIGEDQRLIADVRACYSDEECNRIYDFFTEKTNDNPTHSSILPYMDQYVLRNGIAYPLMLSYREAGVGTIVFYPDLPFEYAEEEIISSNECILADVMIDPLDPDYLDALNYAREKYGFFCEKQPLPSEDIIHTRGRIINIIITPTDHHVGCQVEIYNYTTLLNRTILIGCVLIILVCSICSFILCKRAKLKRNQIEYERSVTNALAHNYKSSLMIIRSYAENLISGVSEDKKASYEQIIIDETDHLNEGTEKILSFYRTGDAGYRAQIEPIDGSSILKELIKKYESVSSDKKLNWVIMDEEKFIIEGDTVLFSMAMDNLISNAAKYAVNGSEIRISTKKDKLTIENEWNPIDKFIKKPKLLFEAFVTGDETAGRSNSGIGLRVTKDLLERMNLHIRAYTNQKNIIFVIQKKSNFIIKK